MEKVADTIYKFNRTIKENERQLEIARRINEENLSEARKTGEQQGKAEVAKNAKKMGLSVEQIIALTGLSKEEIESL